MEAYLTISKINDFIFCPKSIYFHNLYYDLSSNIYHRNEQTKGKLLHEAIDKQTYSSLKKYLIGIDVYSERYRLMGKIDIFDQDQGILIERKAKINKIYEGYKYQLYAQKICLEEMGYTVKKLKFISILDNKTYFLKTPKLSNLKEFLRTISKIREFDVFAKFQQNKKKCKECIYNNLCDYA